MHSSIAFVLATALTLLATSNAAAIPEANPTLIDRNAATGVQLAPRSACTAYYVGSNDEGGGGPGQASYSTYNFQLSIQGGSKSFDKSLDISGKAVNYNAKATDFGGTHAVDFSASWEDSNNSWDSCQASINGKVTKGTVGKDTISSGTVSTTTDKCTISFTC